MKSRNGTSKCTVFIDPSGTFVVEMSLYWKFPWVPRESHENGKY